MKAAFIAALLAFLSGSALAQHRAGDFDFYVLALSWSPSYCATEGARTNEPQCSGTRPYEFIVHGLWPQYENGYPEYCGRPPRIPQRVIDNVLDLMPSQRLVIHQWRKHGLCAGLEARDYFDLVRAARERVSIPREFVNVDDWRTLSPIEVESAFLAANPGLDSDAIAVTCESRHLREVRVCMTKDLEFHSCPQVDRRACRTGKVAMPPSR